MNEIEQLREVWEEYSRCAGGIDGHLSYCDQRKKSTQFPCTCGCSAVERAIERLLKATRKAGAA